MLDAAHGVGIRTVPAIQRVDVARSEVQVACADTAGGSGRRRPVVALGADAAQSTRLTVAVTRSRGFITIAGLNVPEEFGSSGTDWDAELACEPPPADCGIYPTALTEAVASVTPGPGEPFVGEFLPLRTGRKQLCRCWTQRTERPFARFVLFSGFTHVALKFRKPALILPDA